MHVVTNAMEYSLSYGYEIFIVVSKYCILDITMLEINYSEKSKRRNIASTSIFIV